MVSVQGSKCQNCNHLIEELAKALMEGCPNCKSKSIKFFKKSTLSSDPLKESLNDIFSESPQSGTGAGIKILEKGKFQFDLQALTSNNNSNDAVIIEDHRGVLNIIIDPEA